MYMSMCWSLVCGVQHVHEHVCVSLCAKIIVYCSLYVIRILVPCTCIQYMQHAEYCVSRCMFACCWCVVMCAQHCNFTFVFMCTCTCVLQLNFLQYNFTCLMRESQVASLCGNCFYLLMHARDQLWLWLLT